MLDPEYIDQAGDLVGAVYGEIETDMLTYLSRLLLSNADTVGQRGLTAINLLAQTHAAELLAIIEKHKGAVSVAVAAATSAAIGRSDAADLTALEAAGAAAAAAKAAATLPRQVKLTIQGIAEILERDNVEMATGALDLWNRAVTEAVTKVNTGALTADKAIHGAVRRMMREGITTVQYRDAETGRLTVRNHIDVAVRRHVRTQIAQDGARRTMQVCQDAGIELVEVSSHGGARPSHAKWQGRVYSLHGDVTIDGVRYKDFYRETGYGSVDGLLGANCRHSFGPWIPGTPRMYSPNPEHPSGLSNDEVYALTQKQRAGERAIRQTKRDLAAAELIYDDSDDLNDLAEVLRLKEKLKGQQKKLRDLIADANSRGKADVLQRSPAREWAGDMPKIAKSNASRRTLTEFMKQDATKRAIKGKGLTQAEGAKAIRQELVSRKLTTQGFKAMSKSEQNELRSAAISKHATERMTERSVTQKQIDDALANPIHREEIRTDEQGRRSQKIIGREATAVVNPDTGVIITTYPTSARRRRKYGAE